MSGRGAFCCRTKVDRKDCWTKQKRECRNIPGEGSSAQGKSGPKERPKGVSDGQQVEIPAPPIYLKNARDTGVEGKRGRGKTRIERYSEKYSNEFPRSTLARKACRYCIKVPVPQTDTGR